MFPLSVPCVLRNHPEYPSSVFEIVISISFPLLAAATPIPVPALKCNLLDKPNSKFEPEPAATSGEPKVASERIREPSASHLPPPAAP